MTKPFTKFSEPSPSTSLVIDRKPLDQLTEICKSIYNPTSSKGDIIRIIHARCPPSKPSIKSLCLCALKFITENHFVYQGTDLFVYQRTDRPKDMNKVIHPTSSKGA